ncbi:MAG TPA: hypothetical protein VGM91_17440 [Conexibacter sp.]
MARRPRGRELHRSSTQFMSALMVVIGVVLVVQTIAAGGGAASVRLILGVLFVLAGGGRFYLTLSRSRSSRSGSRRGGRQS